ncbi:MAG: type II toxin-antitoxin system RelE/ParE family toxin [Taibaiella sp.]|jgi:toxin YoeB
MKRSVVWTEKALNDLKEIFNYWNNRNKSKNYSRKLNSLFNQALQLIAVEPLIGLVTDMEGVRIKLVRNYWIFYIEQGHKIFVLQIMNTYQNPDSFLRSLKIKNIE